MLGYEGGWVLRGVLVADVQSEKRKLAEALAKSVVSRESKRMAQCQKDTAGMLYSNSQCVLIWMVIQLSDHLNGCLFDEGNEWRKTSVINGAFFLFSTWMQIPAHENITFGIVIEDLDNVSVFSPIQIESKVSF